MVSLTLLTHEEKLRKIQALQNKFHRKGELFLPDSEVYPEIFNLPELELAAKKMFVWLGVKPTGIQFVIKKEMIDMPSFKTITLHPDLSTQPYIAAAEILRQVLAISLRKKGLKSDNEIIELTSIELGLGLLFINSVGSSSSIRNRFLRIANRSKYLQSNTLNYYRPDEYGRLLCEYIRNNDLNQAVVYEHVLPWVTNLLPMPILQKHHLAYEPYIILEKQKQTQLLLKSGGLMLVLIMCLGLGLFFWLQRPKHLSVSLQSQKENIEVLDLAYATCMDSLKQKQQTYNTDDFFIIRQIDAHVSRCTSIRNRHDYEVNDYNERLRSLGL